MIFLMERSFNGRGGFSGAPYNLSMVALVRTHESPGFFMIKYVGKIWILLLKVQQFPDFLILQTIYPYVAPMEELARNLKIWIFPNFRHYPRIFASQELHAPGFSLNGY